MLVVVPAAVVLVVVACDEVVVPSAVDVVVDAADGSRPSSSSPRFPGCAAASPTPAISRIAAAASRSRDRMSRGITSSGGSRERVTGVEPAPPAWKAGALPLSYTRVCYQ